MPSPRSTQVDFRTAAVSADADLIARHSHEKAVLGVADLEVCYNLRRETQQHVAVGPK
jgi:hypothetical protein